MDESWYLLDDTQLVHPWILDRPSDVKGFTNTAMAWMPKSGHGADGRLANHHGSPLGLYVACRFKSVRNALRDRS